MVGSFGMGDTLLSWDAVHAGTNLVGKVLASDDGREAAAALLDNARNEVRSLLESNRHIVEALRDALLDRDELIGDEILEVVAGAVGQAV